MSGTVLMWAGRVVAAVAVVGLVVYLTAVGLDDADKWASVLGLFVALAGLAVSVWGQRRAAAPGGQLVENSTVGGGVTSVSGTAGNVRITRRGGTPPPGSPPPGPPPPPPGPGPTGGAPPPQGGQIVRGTHVSGPVDHVRDTGGDVELEQ